MAIISDNAEVYGNAQVYSGAVIKDNARIYDNAKVIDAYIHDNAKVYGDTEVKDHAKVYDNAEIYGNARIYGKAKVDGWAQIYENAQVYGEAHISDMAKVYGTAKVYGNIKITSGKYDCGYYYEDNSLKKIVQDFIYKVDDSNKLTTQTEYNSIDEFFSEPAKNDIKLDTLIICAIDTKEPLIKLQKVETEDKVEIYFIVDLTNENNDFRICSIVKSQEQLNQLVQQAIEALKQYPKFSKYTDDLENCL